MEVESNSGEHARGADESEDANSHSRERHRLTARGVLAIKVPGLHHDGSGLYLQVTKAKGRIRKSWILRYMRDGRARKMGLGPASLVSLADARRHAEVAQKARLANIDPIESRRAERLQARLEAERKKTFRWCAERFIEAKEADGGGWRNAKHRDQWKSTLATYVYPIIGDLAVADIETKQVLETLRPIWGKKRETASRVRGRIEAILDWAKLHNYRSGENPARWRGHLEHDQTLAKPMDREVRHHPAMPHDEAPTFMIELRARSGVSARALELLILTAMRTDAVIGATRAEFDLDAKTWTVPGKRMKRKRNQISKDHKVPLCDRAIEIIKSLPVEEGTDFVFVGARKGQPLSNMAMLQLMRDLRPDYVPHGFRSTFKDWASETTNYPDIVSEMALGHVVSDKVEAAYRRQDLLTKRRALMADWANFLSSQ